MFASPGFASPGECYAQVWAYREIAEAASGQLCLLDRRSRQASPCGFPPTPITRIRMRMPSIPGFREVMSLTAEMWIKWWRGAIRYPWTARCP